MGKQVKPSVLDTEDTEGSTPSRGKKCTKCAAEKQLSAFNRKKGGYSSWCKACHCAFSSTHYDSNKNYYKNKARKYNDQIKKTHRELMRDMKRVPCADCGNRFPVVAMDFDHLSSSKKLAPVSKLLGHNKKVLLTEISKCEVVCSNCHRIRTALRAGRDPDK